MCSEGNFHDTGFHSASPLHAVADIGATKIVQLLLLRGADVNLVNAHVSPRTALCGAAKCDSLQVAELLLTTHTHLLTSPATGLMFCRESLPDATAMNTVSS